MRCDGCGRLLGLIRSELGCRCWLAINSNAVVPERLVARVKRAQRIAGK